MLYYEYGFYRIGQRHPIRLTLQRWFHIVENHNDVAGYYDDVLKTVTLPNRMQSISQAVPLLLQFPIKRFWVDYDAEADVLYISLHRPQKATNTVATEDGLLLRYKGKELVGITVLDASTRQ